MRHEVARDLSRSAAAFVDVVWPAVARFMGGGDLIPVEGVTTDEMSKRLDMLAGIDGWHVVNEYGMRGVASRVQWDTPYASFTIRKRRTSGGTTEWVKRRLALIEPERGWLAPQIIVQAYVDSQSMRLLYAAVCRAADLYKFAIDDYRNTVWESRRNGDDGNEFAVFWVPWLLERGVTVREHRGDNVEVKQPRPRGFWDDIHAAHG